MKMLKLGRTDISVSQLCLGTMTFPTHTPDAEAHAQMDRALEAGINFLDTAEAYPVMPMSAETGGQTEECVGRWLAQTGRRDDWVIATKVSGPNGGFKREGRGYNGDIIRQAVDESLHRLQTDVIDLYQLHWPDRGSYMFRQNWTYDPSSQDKARTIDHMLDVLRAVDDLIKAGKIRAFGLSNETAWGTAQWLRLSEDNNLPRVASIQNEYSLLCRLYDTDLAELAVNEDVTLLSFSPLATGLLTGKYRDGAIPDHSRMTHGAALGGRNAPRVHDAVNAYLEVAQKHGLDPVHMALAWQHTRPFPISVIFGATRFAQLEHILEGADLSLSDQVIDDINTAHRVHPMPF